MPGVRGADDTSPDLLTLLSTRAAAAPSASLYAMLGVGVIDFVLALFFSGGRYYFAFPFLSLICFAVYGLAARRIIDGTGDADADHARTVDARIVMKATGMLGMASAIAALLCFFFLVLGPSWIS
jgi:hypothetical protein